MWIRTTVGGRQQIYSLPPLATWVILHMKLCWESGRQQDGAGGRTRTPDLLITNQLLYQLSYTSTCAQLGGRSIQLVYNTKPVVSCQGLFCIFSDIFSFHPILERREHPCLTICTRKIPSRIPPVCACCRCGDELYERDVCYLIDEEVICPSCLPDVARETYAHCRTTAGELRRLQED